MSPLPPGAFDAINWLLTTVPATSDHTRQPVAALSPGLVPAVTDVVEPWLKPEFVSRLTLSAKTLADNSVVKTTIAKIFFGDGFILSHPREHKLQSFRQTLGP